MNRLIDADALNAAMYHEAFETDTDMQKWDSGCWIRYKMFERAIKAAPTIEAGPMRHGHWEIKEVWSLAFPSIERPFCSLCGGQGSTSYQYGYCPYCGAKMDEVSE